MMYKWTDNMVRFMQEASEKSNYFEDLAKLVFDISGFKQNVCDAGCGLGQLAIALSKYYPRVTGIDINDNALSAFINSIEKNGVKNVVLHKADLLTYKPEKKYDLMVFNYFGDIEQIMQIRETCCKGTTVIIKRNYKSHRFSIEHKPIETNNRQSAVDYFQSHNIAYREIEFEHEFGQPFRSMEDAILFFNTYSRDGDKNLITADNVKSRLKETEDKDFPYYMNHVKKSSILII